MTIAFQSPEHLRRWTRPGAGDHVASRPASRCCALLICAALSASQAVQAESWMTQIGGAGPEVVFDLAEVPDGRLCATGTFSSTALFGEESEQVSLRAAEAQDIYLACFKPEGRLAWAVQFGGDISDQPRAIAVLPDGDILLAGHFLNDFGVGQQKTLRARGSADMFLFRIDRAGSPVWSRRFGGSFADSASSLAVAANGDILLAGNFQDSMFLDVAGERREMVSDGGRDAFVMRLDTNGTVLWAERFGGDGRDEASRVAADAAGNVYIAGTFENYASTGQGNGELVARENEDAFLISFDGGGRLNWSRQLAGAGREYVSGLATDAQGNVYASGNFSGNISFPAGVSLHSQGGSDIFLLKLDADGNQLWARRIGGARDDESFDLALTGDEGVVVSGHFHSEISLPLDGGGLILPAPADGNSDGLLIVLDNEGNYRNAITAVGDGVATMFTIAALQGGGIASAGFFNKEVKVAIDGLRTLVKRGETDVFLLKTDTGGYRPAKNGVVNRDSGGSAVLPAP